MNSAGFWLSISIYLLGWIALLFAPLRHRFCWIVARSCAMALAIGYCLLLLCTMDQITGWQKLIFSETFVAWQFWSAMPLSVLHILAFNLFIGSWQVEDTPRHQIPHIIIVPCLIVTALIGPAGFVLHILLRDVWKWRLEKKKVRPVA
jgi:Domain of unknown function (DUF4281)